MDARRCSITPRIGLHDRGALHRSIRLPLVWLVAFALVVYGQSATLVQLLGTSHRHESSVSSGGLSNFIGDTFRGIREWRAQLQEKLLPGEHVHVGADGARHVHVLGDGSHVHADASHAHAHATYQRHHHIGDTSVIALDALNGDIVSDASAHAAGASLMLPLALAPRWALPELSARSLRWPSERPARWADAAPRLPERPPRT